LKFNALILFAAILLALLFNLGAAFAVDHSGHNMSGRDTVQPEEKLQGASTDEQQMTGSKNEYSNQGNSAHDGHVFQGSPDSGKADNWPLLGGFGLINGLTLLSAAILKSKSKKEGGSQVG